MNLAAKSLALAFGSLVGLLGSAGRVDAGLIALYQFNNPNDLGLDSSGNNNNATNFGATYTGSGYQGGAAIFDSNSRQYLKAPVDISPKMYPELTIGAWVQTTALNPITGYSEGAIVSSDAGGFSRTLDVDTRGSNGTATYSAFTGTGVLSSGVSALDAGWTFVAAVYDGANSQMTFYVGGNPGITVTTGFNTTPYSIFDIGANPGFGEYFTGEIDNVFVYDQALTSGQISTIRANGFSSVPEPGSLTLISIGGIAALGLARARRLTPSRA